MNVEQNLINFSTVAIADADNANELTSESLRQVKIAFTQCTAMLARRRVWLVKSKDCVSRREMKSRSGFRSAHERLEVETTSRGNFPRLESSPFEQDSFRMCSLGIQLYSECETYTTRNNNRATIS